MNKMVLKEIKNKKGKLCEVCKKNTADDVWKIKGFERLYICENCLTKALYEIADETLKGGN